MHSMNDRLDSNPSWRFNADANTCHAFDPLMCRAGFLFGMHLLILTLPVLK